VPSGWAVEQFRVEVNIIPSLHREWPRSTRTFASLLVSFGVLCVWRDRANFDAFAHPVSIAQLKANRVQCCSASTYSIEQMSQRGV
jgi:hypothetical protein